jgi:hypothetical protein
MKPPEVRDGREDLGSTCQIPTPVVGAARGLCTGGGKKSTPSIFRRYKGNFTFYLGS